MGFILRHSEDSILFKSYTQGVGYGHNDPRGRVRPQRGGGIFTSEYLKNSSSPKHLPRKFTCVKAFPGSEDLNYIKNDPRD